MHWRGEYVTLRKFTCFYNRYVFSVPTHHNVTISNEIQWSILRNSVSYCNVLITPFYECLDLDKCQIPFLQGGPTLAAY